MGRIGTTSHVRAVLGPLTDRLERLEERAARNAADLAAVKARARRAGVRGARFGLLAALAVVSPRDAIKRMIDYVDAQAGEETEVEVDDVATGNDETAA